MPIITNATLCAANGYQNTTVCWLNYTMAGLNGTNPNVLGNIMANLPWFGLAIWIITYVALFILFNRSGGKEKFLAMGIGGFIISAMYAQIGILGNPGSSSEIGTVAFSFFILLITAIVYALIKDTGE